MFKKPMLAKSTMLDKVETYTGWYSEVKHDGMRAIVTVIDGVVEIYSRTGKSLTAKVPRLTEELALLPTGTYDGEIGHVEKLIRVQGRDVPLVSFNKTMRVLGSGAAVAANKEIDTPISFLPFDLIYPAQQYARRLELEMRLSRLTTSLIYTPVHYENMHGAVYHQIVSQGGEGIILKNPFGFYNEGARSDYWLKVKSVKTFDVITLGFTDGKGKYLNQIGAVEFGAVDIDGAVKYVGRCSGMTDEQRKEWTRTGKVGEVIEIKANDMVGSGTYRTPRHPNFVCIRTDKLPEECSLEQFRA